jgi:hypothetical protein
MHTGSAWPFEDRVLAWLAPHFSGPIEEFHERAGRRLDRHHGGHLIEALDEELFGELAKRLDLLLSGEIHRLKPTTKTRRR